MHAVEHGGGAAAGDEGEDGDGGAGGIEGGFFAGVEGVGGVVAAFGVDVGLDLFDEAGDAGFFEDDDGVDAAEGGDDFGAIEFGVDGAVGAFEGADGGVGIDGDDEGVSEGAGLLEVADVAGVQKVEAAVGEDEVFALAFQGVAQLADVFGGGGVEIGRGHGGSGGR